MDHVNTVLKRNPDNVVLSEVGSHWCESLADLVRLVRLGVPLASGTAAGQSYLVYYLLTVRRQTVLE